MLIKVFCKNDGNIDLNGDNYTYAKRKHKTSIVAFFQTDFSCGHIEQTRGDDPNKSNQKTDKKDNCVVQMLVDFESNISNCFVLFQIRLFIKRLNGCYFFWTSFLTVHIVVGILHLMALAMQQPKSVAMHKFTVCFEMNNASIV